MKVWRHFFALGVTACLLCSWWRCCTVFTCIIDSIGIKSIAAHNSRVISNITHPDPVCISCGHIIWIIPWVGLYFNRKKIQSHLDTDFPFAPHILLHVAGKFLYTCCNTEYSSDCRPFGLLCVNFCWSFVFFFLSYKDIKNTEKINCIVVHISSRNMKIVLTWFYTGLRTVVEVSAAKCWRHWSEM